MASCVLVLDVGSSAAKALLFDLSGKRLALASTPMRYRTPESVAPLGKELDPRWLWRTVCRLARQAMSEARVGARQIVAVTATTQREGCVFLDSRGRELYAGPNVDLRGVMDGLAFDEQHPDLFFQTTGHKPTLMFAPGRLLWFQHNDAPTYEHIRWVLSLSDWLANRLSGELVSERCAACEIGLLDVRTGERPHALLDALGVPVDWMPSLATAGANVGTLTRAAAEALGLRAGAPVVLGGPDTQMGLLGLGVTEPGQVGIVMGWSAPAQMVLNTHAQDSQGRIWTGLHLLPGRWVLESSASEAGAAYRWLAETTLGRANDRSYATMDALAGKVVAGIDGVLAYLGSGIMDLRTLRLGQGGILFNTPFTASPIGRGHMYRAAQESIAYAIRGNCAQLQEVSGQAPSTLRVGGGMTRSALFPQLLANVLARPIEVSTEPEVTGLGAAMAVATGAGTYRSLRQAVREMSPKMRVFEPEGLAAVEYEEHYQRWLRTCAALQQLSQENDTSQ